MNDTTQKILIGCGSAAGAFLLCHAFLPLLIVGGVAAFAGGKELLDKINGG